MSFAAGRHSRRQPSNLSSRRSAPVVPARPDATTNAADYANGRATPPHETPPGDSSERTVGRLWLSKALTVPEGVTVAEACRRMKAKRVDAALLTDAGGLLSGIVTAEDVSGRVVAEGLQPDRTIVSKIMTRSPVYVMSESSALDALKKMVQGKFRHLPVVENNEVIGMLDIKKFLFDAISILEKAAKRGKLIADAMEGVEQQLGSEFTASHALVETVREKLFKPSLSTIIKENSSVPVVCPSDPVVLAAKKMREYKVNSVIVMSAGTMVGILTSKDVLLSVVAQNLPPELTSVDKVMTENPDIATLDTPMLDALHMMQEGKFLHVPVADRENNIIACLDVLQLTKAAISTEEGNPGAMNDMANTILQKFYDSVISNYHTDEELDNNSEASMPLEFVEDNSAFPPQASNSFFFKIEDRKGRVHRFSCVSESLDDLVSVVAHRLEISGEKKDIRLLYEDDEGDKVLITTDSDLSAGVYHARSAGCKVLKLHLDDPDKRSETKTRRKKKGVRPLQLGIVASMVVVVSIGVIVYWKRSKQ